MARCSSLLGQGVQTVGPVSCIFSATCLAGDVKEPTRLSKRVGHGVPGVVIRPSGGGGGVLLEKLCGNVRPASQNP